MRILSAIHMQMIGGVDQVFRNYNEVLLKNGHEVALLISDNGNEDYQFFGIKKIFKLKNFSQIADFLRLLWILISFRPNVVLCHSNRIMKWMRIIKPLPKFLIPTWSVAINHGISFKSSLHCDFIISINQQIADLVAAAGFDKTKSFLLPNVIKIDQNYQKKSINNLPKIGMFARVEKRKGFDILLKAAAILAEKNYDFRLKIGGFEVPQGYYWSDVKKLAKELKILDKCQFVGVVVDKKKFFADVDVFCVPSREEPFGLVILEGFLFSTLVISSNTDGGRFLIKDGENGLVFANENYEDLAKKIENILQGSLNYGDITNKAFSTLEKEFSFVFLEKELETILQKISLKNCQKE